MMESSAMSTVYPQVQFPEDPALPGLSDLFDSEWVWHAYRSGSADELDAPYRIRVLQFSHNPGRNALVCYAVEWRPDQYIPSGYFSVGIDRRKPITLQHFPEDSELPGLAHAADPGSAVALANRHVLAIPVRRGHVEVVRYRPGNRAVLRHRFGKVKLFARVVRPLAVTPMLQAAALVGQSGFVIPRVAGHWSAGGALWFSEIPGRNLRECMRQGDYPDPDDILHNIYALWSASPQGYDYPSFNLSGLYERAKRTIAHAVQSDDEATRSLHDAQRILDSFVTSWQPSCLSHNDFYDDQMLALPDGRIALVDFEEAGPGDPMLDIGNFLAHLRWAASTRLGDEACSINAYHNRFLYASLDRFHWTETELALREAVCLFRICTSVVRRPQRDWEARLKVGLDTVNQILG